MTKVEFNPMVGRKGRTRFLVNQLKLDRKIEICDIGARQMRGATPYQGLIDADVANLSGFEPDPEAFAVLEEAKGPNQRYFNAAVGKPGPATFYLHKIGSLSSIFKLKPDAAHYLGKDFWVKREIREIPMTLVALDDLPDFPRLDVLKMDVQGAELDVLKYGKETLSQAMVVIPEVRFYQMYEDEPMWADVDTELRAQGFVLHRFLHNKSVPSPSPQASRFAVRGLHSQLLDGDAVYIRNLENPDAISTDQWKILALAAETMFASYDLVAHCLAELARRGAVGGMVPTRYVDRLPAEWRNDGPSDETGDQSED